jgi:hypothetical protein
MNEERHQNPKRETGKHHHTQGKRKGKACPASRAGPLLQMQRKKGNAIREEWRAGKSPGKVHHRHIK